VVVRLDQMEWDDGQAIVPLSDGTTMSILTRERCLGTSPLLQAMGRKLGLTEDDWAPPEGKYEVAFVDLVNRRPAGEVIVLEWEDHRAVGSEYAPQWSVYWVTNEQVESYIEKVGVK
jgi:hypothetical protein